MKILTKSEMRKAIESSTAKGNGHYVYGLCRGDNGRIFYIGKGINGRCFDHEKEVIAGKATNTHKARIIAKHGIDGYVLFSAHEEAKDAFMAERDLIAQYGIENLANIGRGGEGQDPEFARQFAKKQWVDPNAKIRQAVSSDEYRAKRSTASKSMWQSDEYREKHAASMESVIPQIAEKLREHFKSPEARHAAGNGSRGRVHSEDERQRRSESVNAAWADESLRQRHSQILSEVSNRPEMRVKRREASIARWSKVSKEERSAQAKEQNNRPEVKAKISAASKAAMQDPEHKARCIAGLLAHNESIKGTGKFGDGPRSIYGDSELGKKIRAKKLADQNKSKEKRAVVSAAAKKQMQDPVMKRKVAEGRRKQAAEKKVLMAAYCKEFSIDKPGKNYCNVDKVHFDKWKVNYA